jgi:multidrug efflux pump subunit AcrA (membrane-fusion protein)
VRKGQEIRVTPEIDGDDLPVENETFMGRIVFVDSRIDPTTRTCKVVAEVRNRDLLLASGLEARMEIFLDHPLVDQSTEKPSVPIPTLLKPAQVSRVETPGARPAGPARESLERP